MAIWEDKQKADLALCIPHQTFVTMEWAFAFRNLKLPSHLYFFNKGMPVDTAREQMTRSALKHDIKYIFYLDTDVVLQPDAVMQLIEFSEKFNLPVISALYYARKRDALGTPAAWKIIERKGNDIKLAPVAVEKYKNKIIEVDTIGMGACLVKREIFDMLDEKNPDKPFFEWGLGRKNLPQVSEDFYFCLRLIDELNIHPYVATSIQASHVSVAEINEGKLELLRI